mgnify:CR=1 FL=1
MTNQQIALIKTDLHTISVFVSNKPGVLLRICLIFSRRAYNIESLVVSPALDGHFSRITLTAQGSKSILDQIIKQLNKLVDVVHAQEHSEQNTVEKEFALIKVKSSKSTLAELLQIIQHFRGNALDFSENSLIVQITGSSDKVDSCLEVFQKYGIIELVRSGKMVMARGSEKT